MRNLKKEEINVKVKQVLNGRVLLLLYKDARVDMDILDELYTPFGWRRSHKEIKGNLFCTIDVWDGNQWISKEDVGIESNMDGEKGEASDAFKRAGFNWGIGRELYTTPQIWVQLKNGESKDNKCYIRFSVSDVQYQDREIIFLQIVDDKNEIRFQWKKPSTIEDTPKRIVSPDSDNVAPIESSGALEAKSDGLSNVPFGLPDEELRQRAYDMVLVCKRDDEWKKKALAAIPDAPIERVNNLIRQMSVEGVRPYNLAKTGDKK